MFLGEVSFSASVRLPPTILFWAGVCIGLNLKQSELQAGARSLRASIMFACLMWTIVARSMLDSQSVVSRVVSATSPTCALRCPKFHIPRVKRGAVSLATSTKKAGTGLLGVRRCPPLQIQILCVLARFLMVWLSLAPSFCPGPLQGSSPVQENDDVHSHSHSGASLPAIRLS